MRRAEGDARARDYQEALKLGSADLLKFEAAW
jgi:hypothetical protein